MSRVSLYIYLIAQKTPKLLHIKREISSNRSRINRVFTYSESKKPLQHQGVVAIVF